MHYNAGATPSDVDSAVDDKNAFFITVKLPTGSDGNAAAAAANDSVVTTVPVDAKLEAAYLTCTPALTNVAGDTITLNVKTNSISAVAFDSDNLTDSNGANSANSVITLSVTTTNSFLDAGEVCLIDYTMEDNTNNYIEGELVLKFSRQ